jgi:hypothetical protein
MGLTIRADERGVLSLPAGLVPPGAQFRLEPQGAVLVLRREPADPEDWWNTTTPEQRVAWFREWMAGLPPAPRLPSEAFSRDSMYD